MTYANIEYFMIRLRTAVLAYIILGGAITSLDPALLGAPYIALIAWATFRYFRCAYISESFVEYASFTLWNLINFCSLLVFASISLTFHYSFNFTERQSLFVATLPILLTLALFGLFSLRQHTGSAFKVNGRRVEVAELAPFTMKDTSVTIIIALALLPLILRYPTPHAIATWLVYGASLFIIYQNREAISGLRELRAQEKDPKRPLLFDNMEEIRKLRNSSLTGRLIKSAFK